MLIDCHTHAFADKIADKAVNQLINYYQMPTSFGGRLTDLLSVANEANLDALVLLVAATRPEQVKPANDWILDLAKTPVEKLKTTLNLPRIPQIIPFGTFHPDDPNWRTEIHRLKAAGIKGIKLHPEFQGIDLADPALTAFFEEVAADFVLMIHVGDPKIIPNNLSTPKKIRQILQNFPKLRIIAAHLGGLYFWEDVLTELVGTNVYLDTSSALPFIDPDLARRIITKHGVEKILFGSDYPLTSPGRELRFFEHFDWLTPSQKDLILGENCRHLLRCP
jgi:predicted TIM-barrel fold metal-dependent hydrolase